MLFFVHVCGPYDWYSVYLSTNHMPQCRRFNYSPRDLFAQTLQDVTEKGLWRLHVRHQRDAKKHVLVHLDRSGRTYQYKSNDDLR